MDLLNSLLDNLIQGVVLMDKEGKILLYNDVANELAKSLLVKPLQEGINLADFVDLKTSLFFREVMHEMNLKKIEKKYSAIVADHLGRKLSLEFKFVPVVSDIGAVTYVHLLVIATQV